MIVKNTWVQIHKILLLPGERAENLPEDTHKVPYEMWVKGFLQVEANLGDQASVKTVTGRVVSGTLCAINPSYLHNYGAFVPEILQIDDMVKTLLYGEQR